MYVVVIRYGARHKEKKHKHSPSKHSFTLIENDKSSQINTLASRGLEEPAHAKRGLEEPFFQLCCCYVSVLVLAGIRFWLYVFGVQYSCGVVLFFLVLAGNSFWCYVRT